MRPQAPRPDAILLADLQSIELWAVWKTANEDEVIMLKFLQEYRDVAPTITRLMLGSTLLFAHGIPKLLEPDRWARTGEAMAHVGVTFAPAFWGFMASAMEVVGGLLFILGLAVRPTAAIQLFIMFVAVMRNLATTGLGGGNAHPVDFAAGAVALLILGGGAYSLDRRLGFDRARQAAPITGAVAVR
jgi:putative oxidoreductase